MQEFQINDLTPQLMVLHNALVGPAIPGDIHGPAEEEACEALPWTISKRKRGSYVKKLAHRHLADAMVSQRLLCRRVQARQPSETPETLYL